MLDEVCCDVVVLKRFIFGKLHFGAGISVTRDSAKREMILKY